MAERKKAGQGCPRPASTIKDGLKVQRAIARLNALSPTMASIILANAGQLANSPAACACKESGNSVTRGAGRLETWLPQADKPSRINGMEIWRIIPDFPAYEVSSLGAVRRAGADMNLKVRTDIQGYRLVTLMKPPHERSADSRRNYTPAKVNRLVCKAFLGMPPIGRNHAAHINGDSADDRLVNLRWASPTENGRDQYLHGTRMRGQRSPLAKLSEQSVVDLRKRRGEGATWAALAGEFSVSIRTARNAVTGATWRHC